MRLDEIQKNPDHRHIYGGLEEKKINQFFSQATDQPTDFNDKIKFCIGRLAGKDGLSFQQIASSDLWDMIFLFMEEMNKKKKVEQRIVPESIVTRPTRKIVSQIVGEQARKEYSKILTEQFNGEYVTLAFDGGSFKGRDYYVGVVYITYKPCHPLLVCFRESVKNQTDMAVVLAETLEKLWMYTDVINVVVDGLPHQIQAMCLFPTSSGDNFQQFLPEGDHNLPFYIPDIPHLIQLMLTHAKNSPDLQLNYFLTEIDEISKEIRKKLAISAIGARCPTYPITRFFYVVPKMKFMVKRKDVIINYYRRCGFFFFTLI
jgi:hypothetical protein